MKSILCVHQGAELYGSDRSFLLSVSLLREKYPDCKITVVLPSEGVLSNKLSMVCDEVIFQCVGNVSRQDIKKPIKCIAKVARSSFSAFKLMMKYDIVYLNTLVVFSFFIAKCFLRKRSYHHVREVPSGLGEKIIFSLLLYFSRSHLIFNSTYTMSAYFISRKNSSVVLNGIEEDSLSDLTEIESLDKKTFDFLVVGRINRWKGQTVVVDALEEVLEKHPDVRITFAGNTAKNQDYFLDSLKSKISAKGVSSAVNFVGFVEDTSLLFANADVTIVPSTSPEPFGRVAAESLYYNTPVIASNIGGLPEIIVDGFNGFLFSPGDSNQLAIRMIEMVEKGNTRKLLENNCRSSFYEKFSELAYKERFLDIFKV